MEVDIGEVHSTVSAVDGGALSPQALQAVVAAVLAALDARERRERRARAERRISAGVAQEQDEEGQA